jgi:hypothetical protein
MKTFDVRAGRLVYELAASSQQARALVVDGRSRSPSDDRMVSQGTAPVTNVAISADGRTVAFSQVRGGDENIYTVPFEGGPPTAVAASAAAEGAPALAPDGSRIAFIRADSTGRTVMVADLRAGTTQRVGALPVSSLGTAFETVVRPRWSSGGMHLAYPGRDQRHFALVDLGRGTEQDLAIPDSAGGGYGEIVPSPDGHAVLASTLRRWTDWGETWAASSDGTGWHRARTPFGENHPVSWAADGWIYLQNHRALMGDYGTGRVELWRTREPDGTAELVAPLPDGCMEADIAADGHRVVCVSHRVESNVYVGTDFDPEIP